MSGPVLHHFLSKTYIFSLFLWCSIIAEANDYSFYNINEIYGTSIRGANSVCEDECGFIWVSSKAGIYRFTEDDKRQYHLPYITPNVLSVKLLYRNYHLYAYTNNGQFFEYNSLSDKFEFILDLRVLLENDYLVVSDVLVSDDYKFYIAATYGLYHYSEENGIKRINESDQKEHFLEWYNEKYFFWGHSENLYLVNAHSGKTELLSSIGNKEPLQILELYFDKESENLWIGTVTGDAFYYDTRFDRLVPVKPEGFPGQPLMAIEANTDSTIMLGFDGQGLWEFDKKGTRVLNKYREDQDNPGSLAGNGVYDIFKDSKNRVWVCTFTGGVSFFKQTINPVRIIRHRVNTVNSLVNNVVNDVFEDSKKNIWFATNNGISKWNVKKDKWVSFFSSPPGDPRAFLSIFEDSRGRMWAGTWGGGVKVFDPESGNERLRSKDFGDFIFDANQDSDGYMWIGGIVEDIARYDIETDELKKYEKQPVYKIGESSENEMLFGCPYGLISLNKEGGSIEILMPGYIIHDFLVLDGIVWCATSGRGLVSYDIEDEAIEEYDMNNGLPSNFVNSICRDDNSFWLGTENGLCQFFPKTKKVVSYSSNLSLSNNSFNHDAASVLTTGELILGTNQGAVMFYPEDIKDLEIVGKIYFQDIIVSGCTIRDSAVYDLRVPVDSLNLVELAHHRNTLTIELLPVGASVPKTKFSWKLEGVNEDWSKPTSNRFLTFVNLSGGEYELKIRMLSNSLSQVIDERNLTIVIKPAFWNTWWFYLLFSLFIIGILYFVFRYHINLIQQLHSKEKIRFFTNTAHELRTSLTLISGPFEKIEKEYGHFKQGKYYIDLANEQIKGLLNISSQLLDFQKIDEGKAQMNFNMVDVVQLAEQRIMMFESYAQQKGVTLFFNSAETGLFSGLDINKIEKVIDNLLSNAIKYSIENGKVQVELWKNKKSWFLSVQDEGIGISTAGQKQLFKEFYRSPNAVNSSVVGSGIGLLMVKNYSEMHGGKVRFESQENVGSTFTLEIPLRNVGNSYKNCDVTNESPQTIGINSNSVVDDLPGKDQEIGRKMSILIVEDNERLKSFLEVSLRDEFNVCTASDGQMALDIVHRKTPDMVVSDILMPGMDGFELCEKMKSNSETAHIPVVLLTALEGKALQLKGLGLGADAYLTKPFDLRLLEGRIKSIISNRKVVIDRSLKLIDCDRETSLFENKLNERFVKRALEVVESNMSNLKFGKEEFSSEMSVSPSLLYKKVKSLTGQSPSDFIRAVRLNYTLKLLQTGGYTVTEVSEKAGFSSVGYFSTAFKKFYGKSPKDIIGNK
ncbi:two-component regulator propeller domain-containing protein [Marinilabilia sp.]|uniref:hybrid sensor histidine kinase/response regulator transcription factor n=1 Tax=Marinilabilia sp. TaxID=2021252 RepID=UPI0025C25C86|nr:two-component regulator propeller domain-containing protein [Marinilabilia sp.]